MEVVRVGVFVTEVKLILPIRCKSCVKVKLAAVTLLASKRAVSCGSGFLAALAPPLVVNHIAELKRADTPLTA
mgnify:CR=1 FL=1